MVRISSLPDLSRFVKRDGKIKVYNSVLLLVGLETVEVSGCVISQKSEILQNLVGNQSEVYLDQFTGELDGVQDCVELLYGGEVELKERNIKTIFKFSVMYEIQDMQILCLDWIKGHVSKINLYSFIQFGIIMDRIGQGNSKILDICTDFIKGNIQNDLIEISQSWSFHNNINFIKFLVQKDILYYTLPVLTSWVSSDASIKLILQELDSNGIAEALYEYGERSSCLLDKMSENVQSFDTSKKLLKVRSIHSRNYRESGESSKSVPNKDFACLLTEDYDSFSLDKVFGLEEDYRLQHFQFLEIVIVWIMSNNASEDDVNRLWCNIRQTELSYDFLHCVRDTISSSLSLGVSALVVKWLNYDQYDYLSDYVELAKHSQFASLEINKKCKKCDAPYNIKVKLVNKIPCYEVEVDDSACVVDHVYISTISQGKGYYLSLLTNSYCYVTEKIKQYLCSNTAIYLEFMYKCGKCDKK